MCYFITVAIHGDDLAQLESILPEPVRLSLQNHPQLNSVLPSGFQQHVITEREESCSCGLFRTDHGPLESTHCELEQFIKRKRKAGWSEAKIQRASASRRLALQETEHDDWVGFHPEIVTALKSARPTTRGLFLCIHDYHAGIDSEPMKLTRKRLNVSKLGDLSNSTLEDVLWELL